MKLVWSPETASKAYIDTVKTCKKFKESDHVELISAMAGGWKPRMIVEAWSSGSNITTSIGLGIAARHLGARYVCIVQNKRSKLEYEATAKDHALPLPELVVGEAKDVMARLPEVEFMVVDGRRKDLYELFALAKLSHRGAVLLCTNGRQRFMTGFGWDLVVGDKSRLVRSAVIPVGQGLYVAYVKKNRESEKSTVRRKYSRWITRIDQKTGEEHVFRG